MPLNREMLRRRLLGQAKAQAGKEEVAEEAISVAWSFDSMAG